MNDINDKKEVQSMAEHLEPFYQDEFITLYCGDVRDILPQLPAGIVQCVVTSPPYFGLRDYGTADWQGGDVGCDHKGNALSSSRSTLHEKPEQKKMEAGMPYKDCCPKCGAVRVDRQLGLERTPSEFTETLADVFDEVRRVMRPGSTLFLNLGDSYAGSGMGAANYPESASVKQKSNHGSTTASGRAGELYGFKPKDLMGVPWRTAFALQDRGWWLRSEIIWYKRNPMPESVTDRPTKAHEQIFLLANAAKYFYDAEAVKDASPTAGQEVKMPDGMATYAGGHTSIHKDGREKGKNNGFIQPPTRNARSVWDITTQPFSGAHFAVFPKEIPTRCIKAGTSLKGQCKSCGKPYVRVVEKGFASHDVDPNSKYDTGSNAERMNRLRDSARARGFEYGEGKERDRSFEWSRNGKDGSGSTLDTEIPETTTLGWRATCKCVDADIEPQIVLDPFCGSGTTLVIAKQMGRRAIGIELNPEYAAMAVERIKRETSLPLFDGGLG